MIERFVKAQEKTYSAALAELRAGEKRGHWIWWVFPQMRGLGTSEYSVFYGIEDMMEARAYLQHPVLGPRYRDCVEAVQEQLFYRGKSPVSVMGSDVDVMKLRSSLELFLDQVLQARTLSGAEGLAEKMHQILVHKLGWRHPLERTSCGRCNFTRLDLKDTASMLSSGHVLISGMAGTGKTLLLNCWLLPWLRAQGHPYVVCDFHGDLDRLPRALVFDPNLQSASDIAGLASDALGQSAVVTRTDNAWSNGCQWGLFVSAIAEQVKAGKGPTRPWFLVVDVSSHCFELTALWEFLPVAQSYGCTVIVTAHGAGRLPDGAIERFAVFAQLACQIPSEVFPLDTSDPKSWRRLIGSLMPRQMLLKVGSSAPTGRHL